MLAINRFYALINKATNYDATLIYSKARFEARRVDMNNSVSLNQLYNNRNLNIHIFSLINLFEIKCNVKLANVTKKYALVLIRFYLMR